MRRYTYSGCECRRRRLAHDRSSKEPYPPKGVVGTGRGVAFCSCEEGGMLSREYARQWSVVGECPVVRSEKEQARLRIGKGY